MWAHWVHGYTLDTCVYTGYMCAFWVYVCTLDTCVYTDTCGHTGYMCIHWVQVCTWGTCTMLHVFVTAATKHLEKISKRQGFILAQSIMRRQVWWQAQEDALCPQTGSKFFPSLFLLYIHSGSPESGMVSPSLKLDLPISIRTIISEVWMMCIIWPVQLHA